MRLKISSRICPRSGPPMASRSSSSEVSPMPRANSAGSIAEGSIRSTSMLTLAPLRRCWLSSLDPGARDRAGDHQALDLGGALEDRVDLGVAVHPLHRVLARVAVAAEDLDRALRRPHGDLPGLELGYRTLGGLEVLAGPPHPRRSPDQETGGIDLHPHVGEGKG